MATQNLLCQGFQGSEGARMVDKPAVLGSPGLGKIAMAT